MSIVQIVAIVGSIPLFSMRTFLPAFLTALLLTYPNLFPGMEAIPVLPEDSFITQDWVLITLGLLSVLEIIGDKSATIRNMMKDVQTYLKPLLFLLINLSLLDSASVEILEEMQMAAFDPGWILLGLGTLIVHWLASLRRDFTTFLENIDEDDNFRLGKITSWLEDSLVLFGFFLLLFAGILMIVLYAAGIAFFIYQRRRYAKKLEEQKITCPNCEEKNLPFAINCYNCKTSLPQVHKIGVFGQKKSELVTEISKHRLRLLSLRNCPSCGNRLQNSKIRQTCNKCGNSIFDPPEVKDFIKYQDRKFYRITAISFFLGFIPVVGFVFSAIWANVELFSPFRRYIPTTSSIGAKILIKIMTFFFFLLGAALGFIAAPLYIILRYFVWKRKFVKNARAA